MSWGEAGSGSSSASGGTPARGGRAGRQRPLPSLKARALRLLSQREHSRAELERKLRFRPGVDASATPGQTDTGTADGHACDSEHAAQAHAQALAAVLDELQAKGYIHEERVADSVLHRRAAQWGASRVRQALQAKGLSDGVVQDAVRSLRDTERERATEVWRKKFGQPATSPSDQARQMRFLAARGFAADVVRRVVQDAHRHADPADDGDA